MKFFFGVVNFGFRFRKFVPKMLKFCSKRRKGGYKVHFGSLFHGRQHWSGYFFAAAAVAQPVDHPSKVAVWFNSTDVGSIPDCGIGVRKKPSRAIYEANLEVSARFGK